jgi:hypothetical protein
MRASLVLVAAALGAAALACTGHDRAAQTKVTSAPAPAATGPVGGTIPQTGVLGTGQTTRPYAPPRGATTPAMDGGTLGAPPTPR